MCYSTRKQFFQLCTWWNCNVDKTNTLYLIPVNIGSIVFALPWSHSPLRVLAKRYKYVVYSESETCGYGSRNMTSCKTRGQSGHATVHQNAGSRKSAVLPPAWSDTACPADCTIVVFLALLPPDNHRAFWHVLSQFPPPISDLVEYNVQTQVCSKEGSGKCNISRSVEETNWERRYVVPTCPITVVSFENSILLAIVISSM